MSVDELISKVGAAIVNPVLGLLFAVALLVFVWGVFEMLWQYDSEDARKTGVQHMLWGVVGMTIMLSAWAIIEIVKATIGA